MSAGHLGMHPACKAFYENLYGIALPADPPASETVEARRRAIGRLNDWISTMPTSPGKTQALIDLNVILTADRAAIRAALSDTAEDADKPRDAS